MMHLGTTVIITIEVDEIMVQIYRDKNIYAVTIHKNNIKASK